MRIFTFDIETTDFKANFGHILLWAGKFINEDTIYSDRIDVDFTADLRSRVNDRRITQTLIDQINRADAVVFHYGSGFDMPFVNTRALIHGLNPPRPVPQIDTWRVARKNLALTSNRLVTLAETINPADAQKGSLSKAEWQLAGLGDSETLDRMMKYCIQDVIATERAYLRLRPFVRNHPYVGNVPAVDDAHLTYVCPACGSHHALRQRPRRTRCYAIRMVNCYACGHWFEGKRKKIA